MERISYYLSLTSEEKRIFLFVIISVLIGIFLSIKNVDIYKKYEKNFEEREKQKIVDINKASFSELVRLPGIGPVTAKRIIKLREELGGFRSFEDLLKVKGIGRKKLDKLRGRISIGGKSDY